MISTVKRVRNSPFVLLFTAETVPLTMRDILWSAIFPIEPLSEMRRLELGGQRKGGLLLLLGLGFWN